VSISKKPGLKSEKSMIPQTITRDWARRLLALEIAVTDSSLDSDAAALVFYERLRVQLRTPLGVDGFQALASRAVRLAKSEASGLRAARVSADGSLQGFVPTSTPDDIPTHEHQAFEERGVVLIAQLLSLLLVLLGEGATVKMVNSVHAQSDIVLESEADTMPQALVGVLQEVGYLKGIGERLETLADLHPSLGDGLVTVAGNIRSIAAALEIFTLVKGKYSRLQDGASGNPPSSFIM